MTVAELKSALADFPDAAEVYIEAPDEAPEPVIDLTVDEDGDVRLCSFELEAEDDETEDEE